MPSSEFHRACESGDIEKAKEELLAEEKLTIHVIGYAFRRACYEGHLELAKWILDMSPKKSSTITFDSHDPFMFACRNKKVEVAEWLVSLKPFLYEVRQLESGKLKAIIKNGHQVFRHACLVGDLEAAQWLLSENPRMAITKMELDEIFGVVCLKGFLELAQWLLSVKPKIDVHADKDFALKSATKNGHLDIIQWLSTF